MPYLIGSIICSTVFAQIYKFATARGYDVDWVSAISFMSGTLLLLLAWTPNREAIAWPTIGLGIAFGLTSGMAQLTFFRALPYGRLSVSWAIIQLAMLMPVLAGVLAWGERPTPWQGAAIGGAVSGVVLMGDVELRQVRRPLAWAGWLGLAYVLSGLAQISLKAQSSLELDGSGVAFLLIAYGVSALLSLPLVRGRRPGRREIAMGIVRCVAILCTHVLLLKATAVLPGYLVFPVYSLGNVVSNVFLAILVWGERPQARVFVGMFLAVVAIVVLSL